MAVPIRLEDVERTLRPWLGEFFLSSSSFAEGASALMREYSPYRETLEELRERLERFVLVNINRITNGSMTVMLDNFRAVRLRLRDIASVTDELMGIVFDALSPFSANFERLNEYALHVESLSAMRVLYQRYRSFFTDEEYRFLKSMIRSIYPPERYAHWLKDDEPEQRGEMR